MAFHVCAGAKSGMTSNYQRKIYIINYRYIGHTHIYIYNIQWFKFTLKQEGFIVL